MPYKDKAFPETSKKIAALPHLETPLLPFYSNLMAHLRSACRKGANFMPNKKAPTFAGATNKMKNAL